jgi:hypothetical protein
VHSDSEACLDVLERHDLGFVHQVLTIQGEREGSLTSFATRYRTNLPFRLFALTQYGPKYLSEAEIKERIRLHLKPYYDYLAAQVYRRREPDFWAFHRRKMAEVGYPLSRARLARCVFTLACEFLFNPKKAVEGVLRRARRRPPAATLPSSSLP